MITAEDTITIGRPVHDVFAYVSDLRNDPAWHTDLLTVEQTSPGPAGVGTAYRATIKPFMGNNQALMEIVGFTPDRGLELTGSMGPLRPRISFSFAGGNGGTSVTRRIQLQPPGLMRLMQPIMGPMFRRRNVQFLGNLKRVLEEGGQHVN